MYQSKVTTSLACIHGQVTKHTTVKWPIDCFLEVNCYIFKEANAYVERNVFFEMLHTACVQINSGEIFVHQLGLVREPVWA